MHASQSLWHHKDFLKLWTGETISAFGSQITAFALPLTAVLMLGATPVQMGILSFLAFAPMLFLTLFAGVLVDRLPRRPILIFTSLGQAIMLATVPLVALFGLLYIAYLYIVVLYVVHDLAIKPIIFGFITATGSIGALVGSFVASPIAKRFGIGPTIIGSVFCYGIGALFLPLAGGSSWLVILCLLLNWFIQNTMLIIFNITQVSMRQAITPWHLQGRMNASMRFIICSALPLGSLLGGLLGTAIGLHATILIGVLGMSLAFLWVLFSPLAHMRE